jgi:lauroyl/myristoyl acyltransferase
MSADASRLGRKRTLATLLDGPPAIRALILRSEPRRFFQIVRRTMVAASWFWPHTRRRARCFREVLRGSLSRRELAARTRLYLYHSRLVKDVEVAWIHWGHRYHDWIALEGESNLRSAIQQGRGAVLLSPHNFGYSKLVAPVLSARGYRVHRGGNGGKKAQYRIDRWGQSGKLDWMYLNYKGDYWHRVQVLKSMQQALNANDVLHVSPRAFAQGDESMAIEIFGRKYYWDAGWFNFFRICRAPLLPCFAIAGSDGRFRIVIDPALPAADESAAREFSPIARDYIMRYPECGRLWKSLHAHKGKW